METPNPARPDGRCTAGLLTFNGEADAPDCVAALLAQTEPAIDVRWIDNASTDATVEKVLDRHPEFVAPDRMESNIGFCGGHNRAFAASIAPYYLALNQDAILSPDYIARLCDRMDEDPSLAAVSGLVVSADSRRVLSAGMAVSRARFPWELNAGEIPPENPAGELRIVPAVTGAAIMIRRSAVARLSPDPDALFAPEFFAYFEEADLAMRIARAGLRCGTDTGARAWHRERGREGRARPAIHAHYLKNHWLITLRHDTPREFLADLPRILAGEVRHYLPRYVASPGATLRALAALPGCIGPTLRFRRWADANFDPDAGGRAVFYRESVRLLKDRG